MMWWDWSNRARVVCRVPCADCKTGVVSGVHKYLVFVILRDTRLPLLVDQQHELNRHVATVSVAFVSLHASTALPTRMVAHSEPTRASTMHTK